MAAQLPADGLPSGPIMFLAEVIAEAIGEQRTVEDQRNGVWWISGGCTPQTAGCKLNLRDVAEAVLVNLSDCGYGPKQTDLLKALKAAVADLEQTLTWRGEGWECSEDELLGEARAAIAKAEGRHEGYGPDDYPEPFGNETRGSPP